MHLRDTRMMAASSIESSTTAFSRRPSNAKSAARLKFSRERERRREVVRYISFIASIVSCLCVGSVNTYSLYGHLFQERLGYTQLQVNSVSIAAELALYLPASGIGYACDRVGPVVPSLASAVLSALGYLLAALTYNSGKDSAASRTHASALSVCVMTAAFVMIGLATALMYICAVTTCAKNFGKSKYKGFALACPIAAIGTSGLWLSQVGSKVFYERLPNGGKGDIDVLRFFIFLAVLISSVGLLDTFVLKVVPEDDLAMDVEEHSRLLDDSETSNDQETYGTTDLDSNHQPAKARHASVAVRDEAIRTSWHLNQHSRVFLRDHTMWWLAFGFFLVSGPAEAFNTNLGTILGTLQPLDATAKIPRTSPATQISIVALTSIVARLVFGTLTDILAPIPTPVSGKPPASLFTCPPSRLFSFSISRVWFLIFSAFLLFMGQLLLATGVMQNHSERFWIVSMLIGSGYGALFSLTPLIISVIWGVENFGTNWGIVAMVPAFGVTLWSLIYSLVYQAHGNHAIKVADGPEGVFCYGKACYSATFWAMCLSVWIGCASWLWAWKGKRGWNSQGKFL